MKLTEKKLKQLIAEEIGNLSEIENITQTQQLGSEAPPPEVPPAKEKTNSVSKLKLELTQVSKNIQNVKGLDANEVNLISSLIGVVLNLASTGSASTILQRVYDVLQKKVK